MMSNMAYYPPPHDAMHHHHHHHHMHHPQHHHDPNNHWYRHGALAGMSSAVHEKVSNIVQNSSFLKTAPQVEIPSFDRHEIEVLPHLLGHGAFSQVHAVTRLHVRRDDRAPQYHRKKLLAEQVAAPTTVAGGRAPYVLKHLRGDLVRNREDLENAAIDLCVEVLFLTRLDHPNIIKVRGLANGWTSAFRDRHDGFFILMDRLEPLDHRIHRWRDRLHHPAARQVSLSRKISYASQIADAVSYLHDRRIIFRDLKPSNVGFKVDDAVQLYDFGLCRELPPSSARSGPKDETFLMSGVGTRRYMAPEIVNSNVYNEKADCFSWAMVFVELLTLHKPYPQYSSEQHAEYVCKRGERPVLTQYGIPPVLQALLEQSWAQDLKQRLSMKAISCQLDALVGYSDEEMSLLTTKTPANLDNASLSEAVTDHTLQTQHQPDLVPADESSSQAAEVYFEFPPHFQHLLQDCEILSEYSDMENSCMDLTLTTTASTTWQDSVSTFF